MNKVPSKKKQWGKSYKHCISCISCALHLTRVNLRNVPKYHIAYNSVSQTLFCHDPVIFTLPVRGM